MRFLVFIFLFINGFLYSQKYIYHTKTYSYRSEQVEYPKWKQLSVKNMIIIYESDSIMVDSVMTSNKVVSVYSNIYQEYHLLVVNSYKMDDKGNYSIDFIAKDIWGNECDFSYMGFKHKLIMIIHYPTFTLKYQLKKRVNVSFYLNEPIKTTYD